MQRERLLDIYEIKKNAFQYRNKAPINATHGLPYNSKQPLFPN